MFRTSVTDASRRACRVRAINCAAVAPDSSTSSQMHTSLRPALTLSTCGSRPSTTRPRPRLSALVSACRRVNESGKRSSPTVPARKKNAPATTATTVHRSRTKLTAVVARARRSPARLVRFHERERGERREQRQRQRDVDRRRFAGRRTQQQHHRDAARAEQLRRHHAVRVGRPAQHADQSQRDHCQDERGSTEQELSHGDARRPAPWPAGVLPSRAAPPPATCRRGSDRRVRPRTRRPTRSPAAGW